MGGEKSAFGDWPWQVLVKESTWLGLFTKNKCGGVLISDRHVLTAAHCQPGFLASLLVELGEYDISGPNEFMSTKEQKVRGDTDNNWCDTSDRKSQLIFHHQLIIRELSHFSA